MISRNIIVWSITLALGFLGGAFFSEKRGKIAGPNPRQEATSSTFIADSNLSRKESPAKILKSREHPTEKSNQLREFFSKWSLTDPEAALAGAYAVEPKIYREACIGAVLRHYAKVDPHRGLELLDAVPLGTKVRQGFYMNFFQAFASENLSDALDVFEGLSSDHQKFAGIGVAQAWAVLDPQAALSWVDESFRGGERGSLANAVIGIWGMNDPLEMVEFFKSMPPGRGKDEVTASAASSWATEDPTAARDWVVNNTSGKTRELALGLITSEESRSVVLSLEKLDEQYIQLPQSARPYAAQALVSGLERDELSNALAQVMDLEDGREPLIENILKRSATFDGELVKDFFVDKEPSDLDWGLVYSAVGEWSERDPESAVRWAETIPNTVRDGAISYSLRKWAITNAKAAADYLVKMEGAEETMAIATRAIAETWTGSNPKEAAKWAISLESEAVKPYALDSVSTGWVRDDPEGFSAWLANLDASQQDDIMIQPLVMNKVDRPKEALAWFASLQEPASKEKVASQLNAMWSFQNTEAASRALKTSGLEKQDLDLFVK